MNRLHFILLLIPFILITTAFGDEKAEKKRTQVQVKMTQRAYRDMVSLPLEELDSDWCVVEIKPDAIGGVIYSSGTINQAGELQISSDGEQRLFEGKWTLLAGNPLDGKKSATQGKFRWLEPLKYSGGFQPISNELELKRFPLDYGGTVVCRFDPLAEKKSLFSKMHLVLDNAEWIQAAREAIEQPELAHAVQKSLQEGRLDHVVVRHNPLVAIFAARQVLLAQTLRLSEQSEGVAGIWLKNELAQPVIAFMLTRPEPTIAELSGQSLTLLIERADSTRELESIIQGLEISLQISQGERNQRQIQNLKSLLAIVKQRAEKIQSLELIKKLDQLLK